MIEIHGRWEGSKEVFLSESPTADIMSDSHLTVVPVAGDFLQFSYDWAHEGKKNNGLLLVGIDGRAATGAWIDSWHQASRVMALSGSFYDTGSVDLLGSYAAPPGPNWGWRIVVHFESKEKLEISMYNIFPDGKEVLGVRAKYDRSLRVSE